MHNTICLAIAACIVGMGATAEPFRSSYSPPEDPTKRHFMVHEPAYEKEEERVRPFNFELLDHETGEVSSKKVMAAVESISSEPNSPGPKRLKMSFEADSLAGKDHAETVLRADEQNANIYNKLDANTHTTLHQTPEAGHIDKGKAKIAGPAMEDEGTVSLADLQELMEENADLGAVFSAIRSNYPKNDEIRKKLVDEWAQYVNSYLTKNPTELKTLFQMLGHEGVLVNMLYDGMSYTRRSVCRKTLLDNLQKSWRFPVLCDPADIFWRLGLGMEPIDFTSGQFREWVNYVDHYRMVKKLTNRQRYMPTLVKRYQVKDMLNMLKISANKLYEAVKNLEQATITFGRAKKNEQMAHELESKISIIALVASDFKNYLNTQNPKDEAVVEEVKVLIDSLAKYAASVSALMK